MNIFQEDKNFYSPFYTPHYSRHTKPSLFEPQEAIMLGNLFQRFIYVISGVFQIIVYNLKMKDNNFYLNYRCIICLIDIRIAILTMKK